MTRSSCTLCSCISARCLDLRSKVGLILLFHDDGDLGIPRALIPLLETCNFSLNQIRENPGVGGGGLRNVCEKNPGFPFLSNKSSDFLRRIKVSFKVCLLPGCLPVWLPSPTYVQQGFRKCHSLLSTDQIAAQRFLPTTSYFHDNRYFRFFMIVTCTRQTSRPRQVF